MKEAIGTSLVFNLMMIFVGVLIVILISSIAFTKGFKIRNRVIDRIEANKGFVGAEEVINKDLKSIGYKIVENVSCRERKGQESLTNDHDSYNYCVYEYETSRGKYYGVTVFLSVEIPLINRPINIPIYGETRVLYNKFEVDN